MTYYRERLNEIQSNNDLCGKTFAPLNVPLDSGRHFLWNLEVGCPTQVDF